MKRPERAHVGARQCGDQVCDQPGGNVLAEVTAGLAFPNHQQVTEEIPMVEPTSVRGVVCVVCQQPVPSGARQVDCGDGPEHEACHTEEITELIQAAARATTGRAGLPSFEQMRSGALGRLGDALGELRGEWRRGGGPNRAQLAEVRTARLHIARAKAALDRGRRDSHVPQRGVRAGGSAMTAQFTRRVTAQLRPYDTDLDAGASSVEVAVALVWRRSDPLAVEAGFCRGPRPLAVWQLGLDLLAAGMQETSGLGDVVISPRPGVVELQLSSPDGYAVFWFTRTDVELFLNAVDVLMSPIERETAAAVAVDALVEALLGTGGAP